MTKHNIYRHGHCLITNCNVCTGKLIYCVTCGGIGATMPTECPCTLMTETQLSSVVNGERDFINDGWRRVK